MNYCANCGTSLNEKPPARCTNCGQFTHENPKPTAGALIVDGESRLLLVKRASKPWKGRWDIPGGFCEKGEHPTATIVREINEELGEEVVADSFHGIYMDTYEEHGHTQSTMNIIFTAHLTRGGAATLTSADPNEIQDPTWFRKQDLPWDELAFPRQITAILRDWVASEPAPSEPTPGNSTRQDDD